MIRGAQRRALEEGDQDEGSPDEGPLSKRDIDQGKKVGTAGRNRQSIPKRKCKSKKRLSTDGMSRRTSIRTGDMCGKM